MSEIRPGMSLQKTSRYYLDPKESNGPARTLVPADPKKLAKIKELKARKIRKRNPEEYFNTHITKFQMQRMKDSIII